VKEEWDVGAPVGLNVEHAYLEPLSACALKCALCALQSSFVHFVLFCALCAQECKMHKVGMLHMSRP